MVNRREMLGGVGAAMLLSSMPGGALAAQRDALRLVDPEMREALAEQETIEYSAATAAGPLSPIAS